MAGVALPAPANQTPRPSLSLKEKLGTYHLLSPPSSAKESEDRGSDLSRVHSLDRRKVHLSPLNRDHELITQSFSSGRCVTRGCHHTPPSQGSSESRLEPSYLPNALFRSRARLRYKRNRRGECALGQGKLDFTERSNELLSLKKRNQEA